MTGRKLPIEDVWRRQLLSFIDPADGLLYRPATGWSKREADWGDQALTLYALVTAYADGGDPEPGRPRPRWPRDCSRKPAPATCRRRVQRVHRQEPDGLLRGSTGLRARPWTSPAPRAKVFDEAPSFSADNTFRHGGHMHGNLRTLVGAADYALYTGDAALFAASTRSTARCGRTGTRFGFLPEVIGRKGDVVACETCALMDYVGLGVTPRQPRAPRVLGRHGAPRAQPVRSRASSSTPRGSSGDDRAPTRSSSPGGTSATGGSAPGRAGARPRTSWPAARPWTPTGAVPS